MKSIVPRGLVKSWASSGAVFYDNLVLMAPKVYIETTIPTYLTSRPGRDIVVVGHQRHIANAKMQDAIRELCKAAGFRPPEICTPEELMGE